MTVCQLSLGATYYYYLLLIIISLGASTKLSLKFERKAFGKKWKSVQPTPEIDVTFLNNFAEQVHKK
jgi:hypothetical protein